MTSFSVILSILAPAILASQLLLNSYNHPSFLNQDNGLTSFPQSYLGPTMSGYKTVGYYPNWV